MNRPLLCASVMASDLRTLRIRRDAAGAVADLVELRLDDLAEVDVAGALAGRRTPVVVTCRPIWEGGRFRGSEEERRRILAAALEAGAEHVDVEWRAGFTELLGAATARRIVLSSHDFAGMPGDLAARVAAMLATGARVIKVAVTPRRLSEVLALRELGRDVPAGRRAVLLGMGAHGVVTRLLPARFGSCWSYGGDGVAPGQVDVARMVEEFRFREVGESTLVYGVAGRPVGHSLSPAMHNAAFRAAGLDAVYVPLEAADVADLEAFVNGLGVRGGSVTAPFKVDVLSRMRSVDALTRRVGAANTFRVEPGGWSGTNTDVDGFLAPLEGRLALGRSRCALVGAGGAARAVAVALASRGARVTIYARDPRRAGEVAGLAGGRAAALPPAAGSWDLLVNATPVGMVPDEDATPVEAAALAGGGLVYDLVYRPARTRLLREAEAAGCRTLGGLAMLVAQAERQFEWWTAGPAPPGVMERAARTRLEAGAEAPAGRGL